MEMSKLIKRFLGFVVLAWIAAALFSGEAFAQGSRKDDVVFNAQGRPMAGASVRVCTSSATGQPCSPLALIYSDPALTQALANPLSADGLGNYSFYAAPGRYEIEISGPGIITKQLPNVILPSDPSTPTFTTVTTTSGISAFSLSLTGNLTVSGSASVAGTLDGGRRAGSLRDRGQSMVDNRSDSRGPIPWRDFTAYMPAGGCSSSATDAGANTTGTINGGSATLTLAAASDFKNGCGIAVLHAGPVATLNTPPSTISISSLSRSGSPTVTVVTSGSHGLVVGSGTGINQGVQVSGCSISAYNGTFPIQTHRRFHALHVYGRKQRDRFSDRLHGERRVSGTRTARLGRRPTITKLSRSTRTWELRRRPPRQSRSRRVTQRSRSTTTTK